jgi:hypothetical protein
MNLNSLSLAKSFIEIFQLQDLSCPFELRFCWFIDQNNFTIFTIVETHMWVRQSEGLDALANGRTFSCF